MVIRGFVGPPEPAESVGRYSNGCVLNAERLYPKGPGYEAMHIQLRRNFGHPELIRTITRLGEKIDRGGFGRMLVGDLSLPEGGPFNDGHRSHQTGLDVDIWFWRPNHDRPLTKRERAKLLPRNFVRNDKLDPRLWTSDHEEILRLAAQDSKVTRIFVDAAIKKRLCERYAGQSEWLKKIRPWWNHKDHFHLRIGCPKDSPDCRTQYPPKGGDGCDKSLDWWFTAQAKRLKNVSTGPLQNPPPLPTKCVMGMKKSGNWN